MRPIRQLAFVVNPQKPGAAELGRKLGAVAKKARVKATFFDTTPLERGALHGADACCVVGGDGTLLSAVVEAARDHVPVIGVNRGSLGFLTTYSAEEAIALFPQLLKGEYGLHERTLLACRTSAGQEDVALNDVLIKDEGSSRLVRLGVYADGEFVTDYYADGVIFATPTGSTAYNLSAGGPIIHPDADVIAMTPVCPHTLSNRSVIFRAGVRVRIENRTKDARLVVAVDGQRNLKTVGESPIEISLSPLKLQLVQKPGYQHFEVVRSKLAWSGDSTQPAKRA